MKNMILKLGAIVILSLVGLAQASASGGDTGGNGGAGVMKDGRYMTFYSAGLYTEPQPLDGSNAETPPGLMNFLSFVQKFPYWSTDDKAKLMNTAMPSETHQYFKVKEDNFSQATLDRLLAEFSRVTGQPVDGLKLFAITDIEKGQTFLLPGFYRLSPEDQVAALFHETFWMVSGNGTDYQKIVAAEMAFEAVYMEPTSALRVLNLLNVYGDASYTLVTMAKADQDSGALNGLAVRGEIPLSKLIGPDMIACRGNSCVPGMIKITIFNLIRSYPHSLILNRLWKQIGAARISGTYHVSTLLRGSWDNEGGQYLNELTSAMAPIFSNAILDLTGCFLSVKPESVGAIRCSNSAGLTAIKLAF